MFFFFKFPLFEPSKVDCPNSVCNRFVNSKCYSKSLINFPYKYIFFLWRELGLNLSNYDSPPFTCKNVIWNNIPVGNQPYLWAKH
jgi:hypothetical protein